MRIRNLSSFVKVARLGSFRAAAALLHVSQPAISARVNALEDELGVILFLRDKSGAQLTNKGAKLLVYAEKLLAISQEMKEVAGQQQQHRGSIKIGIADTLAHLWLSPLLQRWQREYPQIAFELTSDVTPVLTQQLQQHQIDLSLMVAEYGSNKALMSQPLCHYEQVWVGENHLQEHDCWSVTQLAEQPILSFPRDTTPWHYLQQLFKSQSGEVVIHTCSSVASLINLAQQGVGIALLPEILVKSQLAAGELSIINTEIAPQPLAFCSSWRVDEEETLPKLLADSAKKIMVDRVS